MEAEPRDATSVAPKEAKTTSAKAAKKAAATSVKAKEAKATKSKAAKEETGLGMTWKCIHSRAYHGAIRMALRQGLSGEEAKTLAAKAVAQAKADMLAGRVSS